MGYQVVAVTLNDGRVFQQAVVDVLVEKLMRAVEQYRVRTVSASTRRPRASRATPSMAASSTSASTTRAPSRASASASARPIPLPPPVTTATRSLKESTAVQVKRAHPLGQIERKRGVGGEGRRL